MEWYLALTLLLGVVCFFLFLGLPVAFAFMAANIFGTALFIGGLAVMGDWTIASLSLQSMPMEFHEAISYSLATIALFLLMGEILLETGVAFKAIGAIERLISRVPGRLSIVSIVGGTVFSSLSGSTVANTAILGKVLLPDMLRRGYHPAIAMGPIMAVGGIAMLIPPSALAVLLASISQKSVALLLVAGIIPGFLMAMSFFAYVIIRCRLNPDLAPPFETDYSYLDRPLTIAINSRRRTLWSRTYTGRWLRPVNRFLPTLLYIFPLFSIFVVVVGSILTNFASPTEAAAMGCLAAFGACLFFRLFKNRITITGIEGADFGWAEIGKALMETAKVNTMIIFIIAGSLVFTQAMAVSGATQGLLKAVTALDLSPLSVVLVMIVILLFLGAFMDQVSMLLLTLPFFLLGPSSLQAVYDIDPIWLMVLILITMEVGLLTPPFGLLLFVMRGVAPDGIRIGQIINSALPFILIELAVLGLLILVPSVATWLPSLVK
ncbi:TRAP transporter large permease [Sagittula stellata]|uniref:TRAP dicarboxylate transporter-DctM subunit n=1 Tax=Sagittula stellata (strain ATCC 700073 / DSM 11524 / E-37) TaxID=388399 RepID=A3K7T1_SAGS3|nr:TRAP transporter large permease subunit [Sagittula stellata]EBA06703.1 TRAP dicarboxylate transporter- DctM subunit [Sagittula stellata E-37]